MSVNPVPGPATRCIAGVHVRTLRTSGSLPAPHRRMQAAPGKYPACTPGVKAMQKYKKLSGLHNNFPPAVIIFTKTE